MKQREILSTLLKDYQKHYDNLLKMNDSYSIIEYCYEHNLQNNIQYYAQYSYKVNSTQSNAMLMVNLIKEDTKESLYKTIRTVYYVLTEYNKNAPINERLVKKINNNISRTKLLQIIEFKLIYLTKVNRIMAELHNL